MKQIDIYGPITTKDSNQDVVTGCATCPLMERGKIEHCNHPNRISFVRPVQSYVSGQAMRPYPEDCPLRGRQLTITLKLADGMTGP